MADPITVTFEPSGIVVSTDGHTALLPLARAAGVAIESSCGGRGICRTCAVWIEAETLPRPRGPDRDGSFTEAELAAGWRRACRTIPESDCTVHVPVRSAGGVISRGKEVGAETVPIAEPVLVRGDAPGLWRRGGETVGPVAGNTALGLAVDLGTTNIAAALVDMETGRVLASGARVNPQVAFGGDVIARLSYALRGEVERRQLQQVAVGAIQTLASELTGDVARNIAEVAVVGNTVMQHLLLALPVASLSRAPYEPAILAPVERHAEEIGLVVAPGAFVYVAPSIAGFVGGDHVAALTEVLAHPPQGRWAMLDIGTNTEIALSTDDGITSVSCASGPAFEGGKLSCGMRAAPGAVERIGLNERAEVSTIGGGTPIGICGSGVLSVVAALRRAELVSRRGRLAIKAPLVRDRAGTREFVLWEDNSGGLPVVFTQADMRNVQLAKSAIRTGLDILLENAGIVAEDLDRLMVAGAFGSFIDIEDAVDIGLLPDLPRDRIVKIGNAAGAGARRLLVCLEKRRETAALAAHARYLELATHESFETCFIVNNGL